MKILQLCLFLVLLALPGVERVGAEAIFEVHRPCLFEKDKSTRLYEGICVDGKVVAADTAIARDPCLAQMEAAMRAMEPHIGEAPKFTENRDGSITLPDVKSPNPGSRLTINLGSVDDMKKKRKAFEQWTAAKRECWRQP